MPDWNDSEVEGWDDPEDSRDVAARRWRPTHVVERVFGVDEYQSVVARIVGFETGPAPDLMIDAVTVGTLLFFTLLFLVVRSFLL